MCRYVHNYCKIGFVMYLVGGYFMISDPRAIKTGSHGANSMGSLIAFLGAGFGALSMVEIERFPKNMPILTQIFGSFFFSTVYQAIIAAFEVGPSLYFSFDPNVGMFGWMASWEQLVTVLVIGFITGVIRNLPFYESYKYFSAQIISGSLLLEPFFGQVGGILLGQDNIPGLFTVVGIIIICLGFLLSGLGEKKQIEEVGPSESGADFEMDIKDVDENNKA